MTPRTTTPKPPATEGTHNIAAPLATLAAPLTNLTGLPGNPRRGDIDAIARSLRVFGQRKPVTARVTGTDEQGNPVGYVTAGNHTLQAARDKLGWSHVAVVWIEEDETTANAWALADNRLSEIGSNDADELATMLAAIASEDPTLFAATAYTDDDLAKLLASNLPPPGDADIMEFPAQWGVMVDCTDEAAQVELLTRLTAEGFTVRALM
jgi:ParB-like chromosome segregation protein Spo0J